MKLIEYRKNLQQPLRRATLCFLFRGDKVLLAMKKRGFGKGRWNGVGGKPKSKETIEETATRETREEINVLLGDLNKVAVIDFYFPHNPDWNQQVIVFIVKDWKGKPKETEEMNPQWFKKDQLPFDSMWPDDKFWLPKVMEGKKIKAEFLFGPNDVVLESRVNEVKIINNVIQN